MFVKFNYREVTNHRSYFKTKMKTFRLYEITFNNGQAVDNAANT